MICSKCGASFADGAKFCTECGAPANAGSETVTSSMDMGTVAPTVSTSAVLDKGSEPIKKKGFGAKFFGVLLWIILVVTLVCTAAVLTCNYMITPMGLKGLAKSGVMNELFDAEDYMTEAFDDIGINTKDLDDKDVENFTFNLYSDALKFYFTGNGEAFNPNLFIDLLDDNKDDIMDKMEDDMGFEISDDDFDDMKDELRDEIEDLNDEIADEREDTFKGDTGLAIVEFLFKTSSLLILLAVDIFVMLLIGLVFGKNKDKSKIYVGVAAIVSGIITGAFVGLVLAAINAEGSMDTGDILPFFLSTIIIAAAYFICGIVSVVMGRSFRKNHTYVK